MLTQNLTPAEMANLMAALTAPEPVDCWDPECEYC